MASDRTGHGAACGPLKTRLRSTEVLARTPASRLHTANGNGRIARTIADMELARSEASSQRFYSMSAQICLERNDYNEILERT
jgi:hypothetical protein